MKRRTMTLEDWIAKGEGLFGSDRTLWRFRCVKCGHVQTPADFRDQGLDPDRYVHFSCIGRWVEDVGCDWTLGGLFHIHTLEVVDGDRTIPVFEFAPIEEAVPIS